MGNRKKCFLGDVVQLKQAINQVRARGEYNSTPARGSITFPLVQNQICFILLYMERITTDLQACFPLIFPM